MLNRINTGIWCPINSSMKKFNLYGFEVGIFNEGFTPPNLNSAQWFQSTGSNPFASYPPAFQKLANGIDPDFLAIKDEPVLHGMTAAQWSAQAESFRKLLPKKLVIGNLEGDKFSSTPGTASSTTIKNLTNYFVVPDIVLMDFYGWSRVRKNPDGSFKEWYGIKPQLNSLWLMTEVNKGLTRKKDIGIVFSLSNQCLEPWSRALTRQEIRQVLFGAASLGATWFVGFPQRVKAAKDAKYRVEGTSDDASDRFALDEAYKCFKIIDAISEIIDRDQPYGNFAFRLNTGETGKVKDFFGQCIVEAGSLGTLAESSPAYLVNDTPILPDPPVPVSSLELRVAKLEDSQNRLDQLIADVSHLISTYRGVS